MVGPHRKTTCWHSTVAIAAATAAQPPIPACSPSAKVARKPGVGDEAALSGMRFVWRAGIPWEELHRPWAGAVAWRAGGACVKGMPVTSGSACLAPSHAGAPSWSGGVRDAKDKACEIVQQGKESAVPCKGAAQDALAGRWRGGCVRGRAVRGPNLAPNLLVFPYSCIGGMNDNFAVLLSNISNIVERLLFVPVAY